MYKNKSRLTNSIFLARVAKVDAEALDTGQEAHDQDNDLSLAVGGDVVILSTRDG
jgi:hypothetical protein